jgi:hypothetical protein
MMALLAYLTAAWKRLQTRRRQRHLIERLKIRRNLGGEAPWPCTDADAPLVLAHSIAFAARRGYSPDLTEILRRMGVVVYEKEGLAAQIGAQVRLVRHPDGCWSLLLDADLAGLPVRVALAWAIERRIASPRAQLCEIFDALALARAVLAAPRHPLLRILLPESAVAEARRIHGDDLDGMARRLRVPPALLAATQT